MLWSTDGAITKAILKHLPPDGKLVALEINPQFISKLKKIADPRLIVLDADVIEVSKNLKGLGLPKIDFVVSGIPFSLLDKKHREMIVRNTYHSLAESGRFVVYQFSLLMLPTLKHVFNKKIPWSLEIRNIIPYFIMVAQK